MTASRPRWLSFSLRALLLLVVGIAVTLGLAVRTIHRQLGAEAALEMCGCDFIYTDEKPTITAQLGALAKGGDAKGVLIVCGSNGRISDREMKYLREFPEIQSIDLSNTSVTNKGLVYLRGLENLSSLDLCGARVTDAGLVTLQSLPSLIDLRLEGTDVSDAGLAHLSSITTLGMLFLRGTEVTEDGLRRFQRAVPDCHVYLDEGPFPIVLEPDLKIAPATQADLPTAP